MADMARAKHLRKQLTRVRGFALENANFEIFLAAK